MRSDLIKLGLYSYYLSINRNFTLVNATLRQKTVENSFSNLSQSIKRKAYNEEFIKESLKLNKIQYNDYFTDPKNRVSLFLLEKIIAFSLQFKGSICTCVNQIFSKENENFILAEQLVRQMFSCLNTYRHFHYVSTLVASFQNILEKRQDNYLKSYLKHYLLVNGVSPNKIKEKSLIEVLDLLQAEQIDLSAMSQAIAYIDYETEFTKLIKIIEIFSIEKTDFLIFFNLFIFIHDFTTYLSNKYSVDRELIANYLVYPDIYPKRKDKVVKNEYFLFSTAFDLLVDPFLIDFSRSPLLKNRKFINELERTAYVNCKNSPVFRTTQISSSILFLYCLDLVQQNVTVDFYSKETLLLNQIKKTMLINNHTALMEKNFTVLSEKANKIYRNTFLFESNRNCLSYQLISKEFIQSIVKLKFTPELESLILQMILTF